METTLLLGDNSPIATADRTEHLTPPTSPDTLSCSVPTDNSDASIRLVPNATTDQQKPPDGNTTGRSEDTSTIITFHPKHDMQHSASGRALTTSNVSAAAGDYNR